MGTTYMFLLHSGIDTGLLNVCGGYSSLYFLTFHKQSSVLPWFICVYNYGPAAIKLKLEFTWKIPKTTNFSIHYQTVVLSGNKALKHRKQ